MSHTHAVSTICMQVFRYEWLSVWFELPILVGVVGSLAGLLGKPFVGVWANHWQHSSRL